MKAPAPETADSVLRWDTGLALLYGAAFEAILLWLPLPRGVLTLVDTCLTLAGILLAFALCIGRPPWFWLAPLRRSAGPSQSGRAARWAPVLLGAAIFIYILVSILEAVFGSAQAPAFTSWLDAGYLAVYPPLLLGILLLPRRRLTIAARLRTALDSMMMSTALLTFSWYFVIGPTLLRGDAAAFTRILGTALPVGDLILAFCMLGVWLQARDRAMNRVIVLFGMGLFGVIVGDAGLDYQLLHGTYVVGAAIDPLWPMSYLVAGLGARELRRLLASGEIAGESQAAGQSARVSPARALAPYAFLPLVGVLVWYTLGQNGNQDVRHGVYGCAALLCGLVLIRQVIALLDNARLNRELTDHTLTLEQRNTELQTMLTTNSALTAANAQLEILANTDLLTGLASRGVLYDRLGQGLLMYQREHTPLSLLLMDLDRFKEVNDSLGHLVGDRLLQQVGTRLKTALRRVDTVARLGGDEFAILLPASDQEGALHVARTVLDLFDPPFEVDGFILTVSISIGVAVASDAVADAGALVRHADVAMYLAKRSQRGYFVYDPALDKQSPERLVLISDLRHAVESEQVLVYYQPKLSMKTGMIHGVEALARWAHPNLGFIPPDRFIPLAEHVGLIRPLTTWVLRRALRQSREWAREGLALDVAVNLSASSFDDQRLGETIAALLRDEAIPPARLILEITENTLMTDPERALGIIRELKALGVRLSIDDFGKGYSSLSYLKHLPVDEIKIDRAFVRGLSGDGSTDRAIVRAIVDVGHALRRSVAAEGVEDRITWETLKMLGCDTAQGFYMGRPMPASEIAEWVKTSPWGAYARVLRDA
ncbi:MAG TPA: EAL domain-containing protein [Chloroflexota bacterium]|nr:EAL domain-containing protein [Chloroflexota bacterium]